MIASTKDKMQGMIVDCIDKHKRYDHPQPQPVKECEVCGCLLGSSAIKGESVVRKKEVFAVFSPYYNNPEPRYMEILFTPYYCKIHAPKEDK
jgi:hypothetical protein